MRRAILGLLLTGCTSDDGTSSTDDPPSTTAEIVLPGDTAAVGGTGGTGHTGAGTGDTAGALPTVDCSLLVPAADLTYTSTTAIVTEEDFDFDGQGWLLSQRGSDLQGIDRYGATHFVAGDIGLDASGIRSTASGQIMIAQPDQGTIRHVDPLTGGSVTLLAGLSNPNGIEAGDDGMIYVTENSSNGYLRMMDPNTESVSVIMPAPYGNGIVLSPDEQTLYFASSASTFGGPTSIVSIVRDAAGEWDPGTFQVIHVQDEYVGSLTVDACGNLYGVEYSAGKVFRLDPVTLVIERLLDLSGSGYNYSALHFSPGFDGWDLNSLYVTSRGELYEIPVGVPGSHVLAP
jgi:sugar lactone lactonase YvrE